MDPTTAIVLEVIRAWDGPIPPRHRDIARLANLSSTRIAKHHLDILDREGYIERGRHPLTHNALQRTIRLTPKGRGWVRIPIIGSIDETGVHYYDH